MVGLWSPEPPPESDNHEVNNPGFLTIIAGSDEESDETHEGYQPLSEFEDAATDTSSDSEQEVDVRDAVTCGFDELERSRTSEDQRKSAGNDKQTWKILNNDLGQRTEAVEPGTSAENSMESFESLPCNIRQPRLEMGEQQVADVLAAMANITLPSSAYPPWSNEVPEEQWKEHLLDRLKHLQDKSPHQN